MSKKLISVLLCLCMVLSSVVIAGAADEKSGCYVGVYYGGAQAGYVALPQNGSVELTAVPSEAGTLGWQINVAGDVWANIAGENTEKLTLTYPMVSNLLRDGAALVRASVQVGETVSYSAPVTVAVQYAEKAAPAASGVVVIDLGPAPVVEEAAPVVEEAAPVVEEAAPVVEETVPVVEETAPVVEETAPVVEGAAPVVEEAAPAAEEAAPVVEETVPEVQAKMAKAPKQVMAMPKLASLGGAPENPPVADKYTITIQYQYEDGSLAATGWSGVYAAGQSIDQPPFVSPTIVGYAPYLNGEPCSQIVLSGTASEDETYTVVYKPVDNSYTVNYHFQNIYNDNYDADKAMETKTCTGITGAAIVPADFEKTYDGFYALLYDSNVTIAGDGSTVVDIYYDRYYYLVNFDLDGGYGVEPVYARHGTAVNAANPTKTGYVFSGWQIGDMPATPGVVPIGGVTYTATWTAANTKYTVLFWYENANDDGYTCIAYKEKNGLSGSEISSGTYKNEPFTGKDDKHFTYNAALAENKIIAGDGTTVINVYYTRNRYTMTFRIGSTVYQEITAKFEEDIADQWPVAGQKYGNYPVVPSNLSYWAGDADRQPKNIYPSSKFYGNAYTKRWFMEERICIDAGMPWKGVTGNLNKTITYYLQGFDGKYVKSDKYTQKASSAASITTPKPLPGFTHWKNDGNNVYYYRNKNTITFLDNFGRTVGQVENVYYDYPLKDVKLNGAPISEFVSPYPPDIEANAYEFAGWYSTPGCYPGTEARLENGLMPDDALTYFAKWVPVTHTVKCYMNDKMSTRFGNDITVNHGGKAVSPGIPENGQYNFVGWFYMDGDEEKAFDFANMPINMDLELYAKWSSNVLVPYTVKYQLEGGTPIADDTTGSGLAGSSKSFVAKGNADLYEGYQTNYFPTEKIANLNLTIEGTNEQIFVYKPQPVAPYKVKYIGVYQNGDEIELFEDKVVNDNEHAVVTEQYKPKTGWMPRVAQQTVPIVADDLNMEKNVIYFYYDEDNEHALYTITHYIQQPDGSYQEYRRSELTGTIDETYSSDPLNIPNYGFNSNHPDTKTSGTLTADGLELKLYYDRLLGDLIVKKSGAQEIDENQSFIFTVNGADDYTSNKEMQIVVIGSGETVIRDLPIGRYTVTEITDWSWRYTPVIGSTDVTVQNQTAEQAETSGANTAAFVNNRTNPYWLSGSAYAVNTENSIQR